MDLPAPAQKSRLVELSEGRMDPAAVRQTPGQAWSAREVGPSERQVHFG